MPLRYILVHLALAAACVWVAARTKPGSRSGRWLGVGLLLTVVAGMVVERRAEWAWDAARLSWPDLVLFTNLSLQGVAALGVLLWRQSAAPSARVRAMLLSAFALGASLWSYAWYFLPTPSGLSGRVDASGYCRQTTNDSCSAAAATMVLHHYGIAATEAEMARLCLTRSRLGTPSLGLQRGLALKAAAREMRPRVLRLRDSRGLSRLRGPGIIRVGLRHGAPKEVAEQMEEYGWTPGVFHAVVVVKGDPQGRWIEVADPSYGREKWPIKSEQELSYLWDGRVLVLAPKGA